VYSALPFLLAMNKGPDGLLGRKGRRIIVIGGGDVALDAARSALRISHGDGVTVAYRRRAEDMPAGEEEVSGGTDEGLKFLYQRSPVQIIGTGRVEGLVVQATQPGPPDAKGRPTTVLVPGTLETLPCDTIIIAVGEKADLTGLPSELDLRLSPRGWAEGKAADGMTDVEGVFASGGRSVVYAMAAGTKAAEAIDAYLQRKDGHPPTPRPDPFGGPVPPKLPDGYGGPTWHL
jgi:glutamate synthase (NADPH) small chain